MSITQENCQMERSLIPVVIDVNHLSLALAEVRGYFLSCVLLRFIAISITWDLVGTILAKNKDFKAIVLKLWSLGP